MKKYMIVLLVLAIACAFSVSTVMAADLEKYDFDGKFSMEMEKGLNFEKSTSQEGYVTFMDASKGYAVMYYADPILKSDYADQFYTGFESEGYNEVSTDGDIKVFEKDGFYVASKYKEGIVVFSLNVDKDKALDSMKTIEFA